MIEPTLIDLGLSLDDRGSLRYLNDFTFENWKRFYIVENHRAGFIRAWHAHERESKFVIAISGTVKIGTVKVDDFESPNEELKPNFRILSHLTNFGLFIPGGYANGFQTLTSDAKLLIFSTSTLSESMSDDYRYQWDLWTSWDENFR